jgi:hypothetical protein
MTLLNTNQSLNQFTQTKSRGFVVADGGLRNVEGVLNNEDDTQVTSCGDLVKLTADTTNTGGRNFAEVTADDDVPYGFVIKVLKQTQYKTGDKIAVVRNYSVITCIANVEVAVGDILYYIPTGTDAGQLTNVADGNIAVGYAVTTAGAGELVDLEIRLSDAVVVPVPPEE